MAVEFQMPKLGLTMEEGLILEWLVEDGAEVREGMPVLIVQTDKVDTEVEAPAAGRINRIGVTGESFACGQQIGWLLAAGEDPPASAAPASSVAAAEPAAPTTPTAPTAGAPTVTGDSVVRTGRAFISPNAKRRAKDLGVDVYSVRGTGPGGRVVSEDVEAAHANPANQLLRTHTTNVSSLTVASPGSPGTVLASYAAVALAELIGIDLRGIPTAPGQKLERNDVVLHIRALIAGNSAPGTSPAIPATAPASPTPIAAPTPTRVEATQPPTSVIPMSGMRNIIATRMHESLRDMAQLTLTMDVDMDAIVADRSKRKKAGSAPGYTDYIIAAAAHALREKPYVNSQVVTDGVALLPEIHVGMAVALDHGLVVPVIRNTDKLSIEELSTETTRLATAARSNKLKLNEMEGGTFSVTALGMFGVDAFTPVINPPNTAILGVGRLRNDTAWVGVGAKAKPTMVQRLTLSLTWDHRAFDGAPAAEFCAKVKELLEDPAALLD
jgi:pyruvate dehydrogenase E2 component (dihydrolipoamide acetyltransferase)